MRIMKFAAVAAAFSLLGTADVEAQGMTIGFKLGASFSNVSIDPDEDTKSLTAFTGGGFLRFPLGPVQLQPELMYITKGFKIDDFDEEIDVEGKFKLSYIEIPVLLVLPLTQGASFSPYVFGGPAFAFEASCKIGVSGGGFSGDVDCEEGEDIERKKFDVGAMFGAGFGIPAGPGSLLIEGRYNFGLINIADTDVDESLKNRSGAVLVGYSIPLGTR